MEKSCVAQLSTGNSYKDYYTRTGGIFNTLPAQAEVTTTQTLNEENIITLDEDSEITTPQPSSNEESNALESRSTVQNIFNPFTFGGGQQQTRGQQTTRVTQSGYGNHRATATGARQQQLEQVDNSKPEANRQPELPIQATVIIGQHQLEQVDKLQEQVASPDSPVEIINLQGVLQEVQLTNSPIRNINSFGPNSIPTNQPTGSRTSLTNRPTASGGNSYSTGGQSSGGQSSGGQSSGGQSSGGQRYGGQSSGGQSSGGQSSGGQSSGGQSSSGQSSGGQSSGGQRYGGQSSGGPTQLNNNQFTSSTRRFSSGQTRTTQFTNRPTGTTQFTSTPGRFSSGLMGNNQFTNQGNRPTTGHSYSNTPTRSNTFGTTSGQQVNRNRFTQGSGFNRGFFRSGDSTGTSSTEGTTGTTNQAPGTTGNTNTESNLTNRQVTGQTNQNNQQTGSQGSNIGTTGTTGITGTTGLGGFTNTDSGFNTITPVTRRSNENINGPTRGGSVGLTGTTSPGVLASQAEGTNRMTENNLINTVTGSGQPQQTFGGQQTNVNGNNVPLTIGNTGIVPNQRGVEDGRQLPIGSAGGQNVGDGNRMRARETGDNFNISASTLDENEDRDQIPDTLPAIFGPDVNSNFGLVPDSSRPRFPNSNFNPYNNRPGFGMQGFPRPGFNQQPKPFPQQNQNRFQQNLNQNQNRFQQNQNLNQNQNRNQNQNQNQNPFQQNVNANQRPFEQNTNQRQNPFQRPTNTFGIGVPLNMTRAVNVNADCLNSNMKINVRFNGSFYGLIYSAGYVHDPECIYINGTGASYYEFYIKSNSCGTLARTSDVNPATPGSGQQNSLQTASNNYRWNTVSVQYNSMIEEEWDQHFKVTCEVGQEYWKTVTFPVLDVNVATGNPLLFTTKPPECFMEIRRGFSLTGNTISGPVTVGDPLTLIIYMRSNSDGFDISVNNCYAHNGANKRLNLIDRQGKDLERVGEHPRGTPILDCDVRNRTRPPWLVVLTEKHCIQSDGNGFQLAINPSAHLKRSLSVPSRERAPKAHVKQTALSAYFKAFRFTGSPALYIECDVHMCKGSCAEQRCNWRAKRTQSRKKRSPFLDQAKEEVEVSEKINLFQSIEVRQEGDEGGVAATVNLSGEPKKHEAKVCIPSFAFAATIAVLSIVLLISTLISMCLCVRHRHMRSDSKIMKSSTQHPEFMRNPLARLP
ncbi:hypothetical protein GQR58_023820 [Nymphon striatum]|nr:hypothetical protein GQR58_023820 [Nymphon striatum]